MSIVLPTEKIAPITANPKNLIMFSVPKIGKTSALAQLPGCLIIDTESGTDYVSALKYKVSTVEDIFNLCKAIKQAGNPYPFIAIDTISALEEIVKPYALKLYQATPAGSKYEGIITNAPMGKQKCPYLVNCWKLVKLFKLQRDLKRWA